MQTILRLQRRANFGSTREWVEASQQCFPRNWRLRPLGVELELTNSCNLNCVGCAQQRDLPKIDDTLTLGKQIEILHELSQLGVKAYSITGGEPTLHLDKIIKIIQSNHGLDLYKLNTNGSLFYDDGTTADFLGKLEKSGFSTKNKDILPVLVVSLGQQTKQGVPLGNGIRVAKYFYQFFPPEKVLLSFNITDANPQNCQKISRHFKSMLINELGDLYDPDIYTLRIFGLTNLTTLNRLGIMSSKTDTLSGVINNFEKSYKSWKCLNTLPPNMDHLPTLIPRILIRPNGQVFACPGYNYTHLIGDLNHQTITVILSEANHNPILRTMFTKGLPGLIDLAEKFLPGIRKQPISVSAAPCDVCQFVSQQLYPKLIT